MRRRDVVAGVASLGALGGAAGVLFGDRSLLTGRNPEADGESSSDAESAGSDRIEIDVLDSPDGGGGTLAVPTDGVTLAMFFSHVCQLCRAQMPELAAAHDRLVDDHGEMVTVLSVTGHGTEEQLREWWDETDGAWTLGYDADRQLASRYGVVGHPVLVAIDETGDSHWESGAGHPGTDGVVDGDRIVRAVEPLLA